MKIEEALDSIGDKLYHYLTIKLGSLQDAEDVLQEVFYRILKYKLRFRLIRNPSAYLFRMARNEAAHYLKKRKRDQKIRYPEEGFTKVIKESLEGPDHRVLDKASEALAEIPDEQREVIVLKFFEQLTFKEIARICGVSMGTITSRYRYGMEKMRKIMEGRDEEHK